MIEKIVTTIGESVIEKCNKCIHQKDSSLVNYEDYEYPQIKVKNCFLEYYDEEVDTIGCANFEILK